jgi:hypothetical protein
MLQMFHLDVSKVDLGDAHVAMATRACFKSIFQLFQIYVANILSGCFKSRSSVAHVAMAPVAGGQRLAIGLRLLPRAARLGLSFPLPSPFLPSISPWQFELDEKTLPDERTNIG